MAFRVGSERCDLHRRAVPGRRGLVRTGAGPESGLKGARHESLAERIARFASAVLAASVEPAELPTVGDG